MYVVGTAGHVDHGKSTLVRALTGIDPDRLREEKERGLTIDLGFAWVTLPSGREISIVDVPGHERFIKNMLAGVGGIDLALLVVAADESVMPQTREHLAILDLLQIKRGIAAITKRDIVGEDLLGITQLEIEEMLAGTSLEGSPICPVSSTTGAGLPELLGAIDSALDLTEQRVDVGRPRLSIDRSFSMPGFGTIVTGTLIDGSLRAGQEVMLARSGKRSRIRGIQSHQSKIDEVWPGTRVAVNLVGLASDEISRGEVLVTPGWLGLTHAIDAQIHLLPTVSKPLRHNLPVTFHAHTAEVPGKVRLLATDELGPGEEAWAQVWLEEPVALVRGDRFIMRSADATLGGGVVVDVDAKRHRRRRPAVVSRLQTLAQGSPTARLISALEAAEPADAAALAKRINVSVTKALDLARQATTEGSTIALGDPVNKETLLYTPVGWSKQSKLAQRALGVFHIQFPLRSGMAREELRSRMGLRGQEAHAVLAHLAATGVLVDEGGSARLPEHRVIVAPEQQKAMDSFVIQLANDPFPSEMPTIAPALLALLDEQGRVVRAGEKIVFETKVYRGIENKILGHLQKQGSVTLANVRDLLGTSRKYAQALLEHLDEQKVTRRVGDERMLLGT